MEIPRDIYDKITCALQENSKISIEQVLDENNFFKPVIVIYPPVGSTFVNQLKIIIIDRGN